MKSMRGLSMGVVFVSLVTGAASIGFAEDAELLKNGSFEEPPIEEGQTNAKPLDWMVFSSVQGSDRISITRELTQDEDQALYMAAQPTPRAFQGVYQSIAVKGGETYTFITHIHNDKDNRISGTMRGQMSIEWLDEFDDEIARSWGPEWNRNLPRLRWNPFRMTATAPANAKLAMFVISQFNEQRGEDGGAFFVDNVTVRPHK